jgi:hypothetical protein
MSISTREVFNKNWQLFKKNKSLYSDQKSDLDNMEGLVNLLGDQLGGVFMETPQGGFENHRGNTVVKQNKLSLENVQLYAYIHYFIARQNRKKSYEQLRNIFTNAVELTEHMSGEDWTEAHMKGVADDEMKKYNNLKNYLQYLDNQQWWNIRDKNNQKMWKIFAD